MFRIPFPIKTKWEHMCTYLRSGGRGLQTFGIVISLKVLFEYKLGHPSSTGEWYAPTEFFIGNWIRNNFYFNLFFYYSYFCKRWPQIECIFPFLYKIIFQLSLFFELPSSTPGRDFLYEIQFRTTFFDLMSIFGSVEP